MGAMSVSADSPFTAAFDVFRMPVLRIRSARDLEQLLVSKKDEVAALIVEPLIQGAGGMRTYPAAELKQYRDLCTAHGVLHLPGLSLEITPARTPARFRQAVAGG